MDLLGILRIKDSNGNWVSVPGLKGDTGEPFKILGIYATAADLEAAVTDPGVGDVYLVGTVGAYDIYLYLADGWHNTGRYMPKGDTGDPAPAASITSAVEAWLAANVDPETGYVLDRTLTQENAAAPADLVGDLKESLTVDINTKTNLYDSSANTSRGCLRADGTVRVTDSYARTDYMPVDPTEYTYSYYGLWVSNDYAFTCFYDADKQLISNASITLYSRRGLTEEYTLLVPENAKFVKFSLWVLSDSEYNCTNTFQFYQIKNQVSIKTQLEKLREENELYNKTAIFFGDSICNGSSADDGKDGWAGRIGNKNSMVWHNYGFNGATVAAVTGHHCISSDVANAVSDYPSPDFVVLEGGTNDADTLKEAGIGTYTEGDYSGSYDTSTFSGAFETMLYNAVQQWPHARIGYISAHKMGNGTNRERRRTFFLRAQELCKKWGIPFIDLWTNSKLNRDMSGQYDSSMTAAENIENHHLYTDGQHLTPDGYELITPQIERWMQGI